MELQYTEKIHAIILRDEGHMRTVTSLSVLLSELHALLLSHSSSPFIYPIPHPPTHTTLSVLSGCPHASLPGAASILGVTLHHSALDSTVFVLLCVCMCVCLRNRVKQHKLCMHVKTVCLHLCTRTLNATSVYCVYNMWVCGFTDQCVLIRAD